MFNPDGFEYWGHVGFLKGGLALADKISTVSPTYAMELLSPEFGMGLEGLLNSRKGMISSASSMALISRLGIRRMILLSSAITAPVP